MADGNRIKTILIDPLNRRVTEQEVERDIDAYYKLIDCDYVESVVRNVPGFDNPIRLYVDEIGGFSDKRQFALMTIYGRLVLVGNALVVGNPTMAGDDTSTKWTVEEIQRIVMFQPKARI